MNKYYDNLKYEVSDPILIKNSKTNLINSTNENDFVRVIFIDVKDISLILESLNYYFFNCSLNIIQDIEKLSTFFQKLYDEE